jgi:hypothetical protein
MPARRQVSHALAAPSAGVLRVATGPWPFAFHPPRSPLVDNGLPVLGGNRWDDPRGSFATLYCASSAEGAFAETISRYRDEPGLLDRIDAFLSGPPDDDYDFELRPGHVPEDYFDNRYLGHIGVDADVRFVDVEHADTHTAAGADLRRLLAPCGIRRIDRSVFLHADRRVTRAIARHYWQLAQYPDHHSWRGLRYTSRLASDWECWAIWEPSPLREGIADVVPVTRTHPALHGAAARLGLTL